MAVRRRRVIRGAGGGLALAARGKGRLRAVGGFEAWRASI
jgi:hypothetical protein